MHGLILGVERAIGFHPTQLKIEAPSAPVKPLRTRENSLADKAFMESLGIAPKFKAIFESREITDGKILQTPDTLLDGGHYSYTVRWGFTEIPFPFENGAIIYSKDQKSSYRISKPEHWIEEKWNEVYITADSEDQELVVMTAGMWFLSPDDPEDDLSEDTVIRVLNEAVDLPLAVGTIAEDYENGKRGADGGIGNKLILPEYFSKRDLIQKD